MFSEYVIQCRSSTGHAANSTRVHAALSNAARSGANSLLPFSFPTLLLLLNFYALSFFLSFLSSLLNYRIDFSRLRFVHRSRSRSRFYGSPLYFQFQTVY